MRSAEVRGCGESLSRSRRGEEGVKKVPVSPRLLSHLLLEPLCFFSRTHALTSSSAPRELPLSPRPRVRASPRPLPRTLKAGESNEFR